MIIQFKTKTITRSQFDKLSDLGGYLPKGYTIVEDEKSEDLKIA